MVKGVEPDIVFGIIQMFVHGRLDSLRVPVCNALEYAAVTCKRKGRDVLAVETPNSISKHVTAKALDQVHQSAASTCSGYDFVELRIEFGKMLQAVLFDHHLGLRKVCLQGFDLFRFDALCRPSGRECFDFLANLDNLFNFLPVDLPHPIAGSRKRLQQALFLQKVEGFTDRRSGDPDLLGQMCFHQYGIRWNLVVQNLLFEMLVNFLTDGNIWYYFEICC